MVAAGGAVRDRGWEWPFGGLSPVAVALGSSALVLGSFWAPSGALAAARRLRVLPGPQLPTGNFAALIVSLGEFGLLFTIPLFLQSMLGLSALEAGAALAVTALGALFAGGAAARSPRRSARARSPAGPRARGPRASSLALLVGPDISAWRLVPALFVYGLGVGLATAQLTGVILADVPARAVRPGVGDPVHLRQVGSAFGIAIIGATLAAGLGSQSKERLVGSRRAGGAGGRDREGGRSRPVAPRSRGLSARAPAGRRPRRSEKAGAAATRPPGPRRSRGSSLLGLFATFLLPHQRHEDL